VPSGTPIHRPHGQLKAADAALPHFGPSAQLDVELEMGWIAGPRKRCRRADLGRRRARARVRLRPRQRLERTRHPELGISAAGPVSREVVRHVDLVLDRHPRRARTVSRRRTRARSGAAALPARTRSTGPTTSNSSCCSRPQRCAKTRGIRTDFPHELPRHVLDGRPPAGARDRKRRDDSPRRSVRHRERSPATSPAVKVR
jgi:hypothetical protein